MEKKIICIGRQYGSGGREVGEKLAEQLDILCYDKLLSSRRRWRAGFRNLLSPVTTKSRLGLPAWCPAIHLQTVYLWAKPSIRSGRMFLKRSAKPFWISPRKGHA